MNERIRKLRDALGLTQKEFGEKIGLKQNTVAVIESGKRETSDQTVLAICRAFNVNEEWLRNGAGEMRNVDASDELEALAKRYDLSVQSQIIVEKFVSLSQADQAAVARYIKEVASGFQSLEDSVSAPDPAPMPQTEEEAIELARRAFRLQKKAEAESSSSNSTDSSGNLDAG